MKIIGQPTDYSEILQRVFYASVASGFVCTLMLANASPTVQSLLDSVPTKTDIGPLRGIKALYVLVPLIIGGISRILKLHDIISNLFRIRYLFDTRCLLFPLAEGTGITLTKDLQEKIRRNRIDLMYSVFYPYAEFKNPVIDEQLVRTAADNWGWFWVFIESSFLFFVTAAILVYLRRWNYVFWCLIVVFVELILLFFLWLACRRSGERQIKAILEDPQRRTNITTHFNKL